MGKTIFVPLERRELDAASLLEQVSETRSQRLCDAPRIGRFPANLVSEARLLLDHEDIEASQPRRSTSRVTAAKTATMSVAARSTPCRDRHPGS
jgi:hypothetical protein